MSPAEASSRVRKACLPCIRAKAKCATSEQRPSECHRCIRLNKQCVFEVAAKKPGPGPKSRSRVRQLEQRVESLIDLIATKNTTSTTPDSSTAPVQVVTPDSSAPTDGAPPDSPPIPAPRYWVESPKFKTFDPVEAGLLDEQHAYRLVEEFKTSFVESFPFVIIEGDGSILQQQQPFLFHAILAVTSYATPRIQYRLSEELRRQLARIIEHSQKGLEILQGLLVYGAWYHAFFHPSNQQLAIIVQLCVALVQDLGLSRRTKPKPGKWAVTDCSMNERPKGSLAEKRAYLGTFFLNVLFAQAWRKRTTLPFTRWMAQCCDAFNGSSIPTDALIRPLIQTSELLSRVNTHFSYDDIEHTDVKGEMMLEISTSSFLGDLAHIKDSASSSPFLNQNTALTLLFTLLDMGINEVCLYSSLWGTSPQQITLPPSLARLKMLHRTMEAGTSYLNTLLRAPESQLYHLSLGTWAGWFYAVIVICRLVFLQENERMGRTALDDIPEEIDNILPRNLDGVVPPANDPGFDICPEDCGWVALTVAREFNIRHLFDQFVEKLSCTLPADCAPWRKARDERDSLYAIASIQHTMLNGFIKRIERQTPTVATSEGTAQYLAGEGVTSYGPFQPTWQTSQPIEVDANGRPGGILSLPFSSFMNFDSINFEGITLPASAFPPQGGEEIYSDLMWDMVMDDFTMPSL
ncbi:hypothetical protein CC86DRAFT_142368 [Ophiobolus disseminans]|uniref:Zn(2)-C6 fungal-type domain-containing protein n=1 Tax=Ophiobolus disseminans TaxID=1469910 RepID=A0A6A7AEM7_9PLEO|nr:hypothetical protein CC86DRAFT_142368 [Ophiobolus disseminans]